MKNRLLYLSRTSMLGGAEISLLDLLKKLDKANYYPIVVLPDKKGLFYQELIKNNIEVNIVKMAFLRKTFNIFLLFWFSINIFFINIYFLFFLLKRRVKIVVCNSFQDSLFISVPSKMLRKKMIIYIKNILDKKWKKYIRAKICDFFADKVIAISKKNAKDFTDFSTNKSKISVIYDGIDPVEFSKISNHQNPLEKYGNAKLKIISVGNISELKGQKLLVEAISVGKIKSLDVKVFFIGNTNFKKDIQYKKEILEFISKNKLEKKVYFLGFQSEIKNFIYHSDVLIHCPILEEGLGMVVLEAFAFGKIVVGTNIGGIPEMIKNGINGFLCSPDKHNLAEKILYIYNNLNKLDSIRSNASKTVEKNFNLQTKVRKTEKVYQSMLGKI